MLLFVDTLKANGLGGTASNPVKVRFALAKFNLTVDKIIAQSDKDFYTGMFPAGRYVAIFQFNREFTKTQIAFINFEINLETHFNVFADTFTPQILSGFTNLQQQIRSKGPNQINLVKLTDEEIFFNPISEN